MDSQFAHGQLQSRSHAQPQPQSAVGHHGPSLQFHHQQVQDTESQASFLQHHHHHHHHHHSNALSGLSGMTVVADSVYPSDLHSFQNSFESVPSSGVVPHQTSAIVPVHNGFEGVDGLPVLLDQADLLSQSRDHSVAIREQQGTPQHGAQTQIHQPQHRKQLPRQRQQQPPSIPQSHGHQASAPATQYSSATTSQVHYGIPAPSSLPEVRTLARLREEAIEDYPTSMDSSSALMDIDASATPPVDLGAQSMQESVGGQLKKQAPSHLSTKVVLDPPGLEQWRQTLFDLEEPVVMTQEEFETYFPHVDNVYSHRSTQRYKRKPFVTHYWDCRMKGRPPGTPKSDDPNKKKRKRHARERDLCDVKIKITEFDAGPSIAELVVASSLSAEMLARVHGQRFWTLQRVNGNGTNGTGDGKPAMHKHTLEKSDEIKKSSIQRLVVAREKTAKKTTKPPATAWKPGSWKPTGLAASTARKHSKVHEMRLYASCLCPFSQRVWIALEAKGLGYQYCEMDPFRNPKPAQLLEANPKGQVPAICHGDWACGESTAILEYLEDLDSTVLLHPTDPKRRATCRFWIEFINAKIVPAFYALLASIDKAMQEEGVEALRRHIKSIVQAANEEGPYFLGEKMCLVDVHFAPFALRFSRILEPFRGWSSGPEPRWQQWVAAMEDNLHVRNTMSLNGLYANTTDLLSRGYKA